MCVMKTINIKSKHHDYSIILHENLVTLLNNYLNPEQRYFIVIDKKLEEKYKNILLECSPKSIIFPIEGGEEAKTLEGYQQLGAELLNNQISKDDILVAFGGGTITDLVGYTAATYKRGMQFINIPTTTLAMVDASIGGKNALNLGSTKNAIGTIYPPKEVLIGFDVLETLPDKHVQNGLFEALKMGLILDEALFNIFKEDYMNKLEEIIIRSIVLKKVIVEQDEDEKGLRKILNYGHTIGHAIELTTDHLLHGEAIANGMLILSKDRAYETDLRTILNKMNCPLISSINDSILNNIQNDKKAANGNIDLVIVNTVGKVQLYNVPIDELKGVIKNYVL